jgi:nucleoside-diphosphate-sugar epimerase
MKLLITGASGFIGSSLYKELSETSSVTGIARSKAQQSSDVCMDLTIPYQDEFREFQFDVIIHCASVLAHPSNIQDMQLFHDNVKISENLIKIVEDTKPRLLINLSSIGVYPNISGEYTENSIIKPSENTEGLYGLSKFCSEELFNILLKNTETKVVNIRLGQTLGKGMRKDRIYEIMKEELKTNNQITVFGSGQRVSSFLEIDELLQYMKQIIDKDQMEGTYNLGLKNMKYIDLAEHIIEQYGDENSIITFRNKGIDAKTEINSNKIKKHLKNE